MQKIVNKTLVSRGTRTNEQKINLEIITSHNSTNQVLRELFQNMKDAKASKMEIRVAPLNDPNNPNDHLVIFIDNGRGMNLENANRFKDFGFSSKTEETEIGNKGVGAKLTYLARKGTKVYTKELGGHVYEIIIHPIDMVKGIIIEPEIYDLGDISLYEASGIEGTQDLTNGTIIIMHNLEVINLNMNVNQLRENIEMHTHIGSFDTLPTLRGNNHVEYPLIKVTVMNKSIEFRGHRQFCSQHAIDFANNVANIKRSNGKQKTIFYDKDNIKNSREAEEIIRILNETTDYKYINLEVPLGFARDSKKAKMYAIMGTPSFLPTCNNGLLKDTTRGMWIGRDGLPVVQVKGSIGSLNYNLYQNYVWFYVDYQGFELTNNRNEIRGFETPSYNKLIDQFKVRIIEDMIVPNKKFFNDLSAKRRDNPSVRQELNAIFSKVSKYETINFENLSKLTKKNKIVERKYAVSERLAWHILEELSEYVEIKEAEGIDFQCLAFISHQKLGYLDGIIIKDEDIEEDVTGELIYPEIKLKTIEIEVNLGNYAIHNHSVDDTDYIACWELKGWEEDCVKNVNGKDAVFTFIDNDRRKPCLKTENEKIIPIICVKELAEKYHLV